MNKLYKISRRDPFYLPEEDKAAMLISALIGSEVEINMSDAEYDGGTYYIPNQKLGNFISFGVKIQKFWYRLKRRYFDKEEMKTLVLPKLEAALKISLGKLKKYAVKHHKKIIHEKKFRDAADEFLKELNISMLPLTINNFQYNEDTSAIT